MLCFYKYAYRLLYYKHVPRRGVSLGLGCVHALVSCLFVCSSNTMQRPTCFNNSTLLTFTFYSRKHIIYSTFQKILQIILGYVEKHSFDDSYNAHAQIKIILLLLLNFLHTAE